jgi:hypothetical protein
MSKYLPAYWLPWFLFRLTLGVSILLILLVLLTPLLDNEEAQVQGWARLVRIFAHDATMRRTAVASAIGLVVTACVFFRTPNGSRRPAPKQPRLPPPTNMAGA